MKIVIRFCYILALLLCSTIVFGQTTISPTVRSSNNDCIIDRIVISNSETIVYVKVPRYKRLGGWVSFSSATVLVPSDAWPISSARQSKLDYPDFAPTTETANLYAAAIKRIKEGRQLMSDAGFLIRSLGPDQLDTRYNVNQSGRDWYYFELHFDKLPIGVEDVYIRELSDGGFEWVGIKINNPFPNTPHTSYSEYSIKQKIDEQNDGITGIYEGTDGNKYKLGCINENGTYKLIYLGSSESYKQWRVGDVKATLRQTATAGLFKADWYMRDKSLDNDWYIAFDGTSMKTIYDGDEELYLKMYPVGNIGASPGTPGTASMWSGSGFALKDGYIVTNHHVVDGAKSITVKGIKGDFSTSYSAEVAAIDKNNDLALIRINDNRFSSFGSIPYSVKTSTSDVGEDVYVLGYPLTTTMGDEIKYTTGVISSKTGFQGDVSVYQISAPIQPGNSGGPLFDSKGNLIGVVNAKHAGAENVGYAIKASYLRNLIESFTTTAIIPTANSVSSLSRTEQIKSIKKFVFLLECSSSQTSTSKPTYSSDSYNSRNGGASVNSSIIGDVKTVVNPQGGSIGGTTITKVELSKSYTKVYIHYVNNYAYSGWCSINPDTYIQGPSGEQLKLVRANNIPLSPNKHSFNYTGETLDFSLEFPALTYCHDIRYFKLVEPGESSWKFYEIIVK